MSTDYRSTCPHRTVTVVHHTIATWLPVSLSCGHLERILWTARPGEQIGCTQCADILTATRCKVREWAHLTPDYVLERLGAWLPQQFPALSHACVLEVLDQIVNDFKAKG